MLDPMIYLASKSPRRRQLLQQLGLAFEVLSVDVVERQTADESADAYVSRVARDKARAGLATIASVDGAVVLGSDTEVVLGDTVFGKPQDADSAAQMLRRLSGRTHRVVSSVWAITAEDEQHATCVSEVSFASLDEERIRAYVDSGEPFGKAGGYAIQGGAAAFIRHLSGSYSCVMGLPLYETASLLRELGVR